MSFKVKQYCTRNEKVVLVKVAFVRLYKKEIYEPVDIRVMRWVCCCRELLRRFVHTSFCHWSTSLQPEWVSQSPAFRLFCIRYATFLPRTLSALSATCTKNRYVSLIFISVECPLSTRYTLWTEGGQCLRQLTCSWCHLLGFCSCSYESLLALWCAAGYNCCLALENLQQCHGVVMSV